MQRSGGNKFPTSITEIPSDVTLRSGQRNFVNPRVEILKIFVVHFTHCKGVHYDLFTNAIFSATIETFLLFKEHVGL